MRVIRQERNFIPDGPVMISAQLMDLFPVDGSLGCIPIRHRHSKSYRLAFP